MLRIPCLPRHANDSQERLSRAIAKGGARSVPLPSIVASPSSTNHAQCSELRVSIPTRGNAFLSLTTGARSNRPSDATVKVTKPASESHEAIEKYRGVGTRDESRAAHRTSTECKVTMKQMQHLYTDLDDRGARCNHEFAIVL